MYATSAAIEDSMAQAARVLPQFFDLVELPESTLEGRSVHALKLTAGRAPDSERRAVLFIGGTHARELMNPDALLDLAIDLISSYSGGRDLQYGAKIFPNSDIRGILESLVIWIVPNINPDGREHVLHVNDLWRKNRRRNVGGSRGVDLNRNLDVLWGVTTPATSCNPADPTYVGTDAFSEPETRNIKWLLDDNRIDCMVDVHSYLNWVLYPWGHASTQTSDRSQVFTSISATPCRPLNPAGYAEYMPPADLAKYRALCADVADSMGQVRGQPYLARPSVALYPTTGTFDDYAYSRHIADPAAHKTLSLTFECGPSTGDPRNSFHPEDPTLIRREAKAGLVTVARDCVDVLDFRDRSIVVTVDFDGRDDETFGSDETVDPRSTSFSVDSPAPPAPLVYRWGGELRAEYSFDTTLLSSGQFDLRCACLLFEGTSESTTDLDGRGTTELSAGPGEWAQDTFVTTNTSEGDPDDFGRLRIVVQNNPRGMLSLFSMWHGARADNHTSANPLLVRVDGHRPDGYALYRRNGYVFHPRALRPARVVPLVSWWNSDAQDNWITSDPGWTGSVGSRREGYRLHRQEGYIYTPTRAQPTGTDPLITWFHPGRRDHFTTSDSRWRGAVGTVRDGYTAIRLEGFVPTG